MLQGKSLLQNRWHVSLPGWWFLAIPGWWLLPSSRWRLLTIFRELLTPGWWRPFPLSWSLSCLWYLITCCVCVWIFTFYTWSFSEFFKFFSPSLCYWNWNKMATECINVLIKNKQAEMQHGGLSIKSTEECSTHEVIILVRILKLTGQLWIIQQVSSFLQRPTQCPLCLDIGVLKTINEKCSTSYLNLHACDLYR